MPIKKYIKKNFVSKNKIKQYIKDLKESDTDMDRYAILILKDIMEE